MGSERLEIIKNEYVYDVAATGVYFTEEGKRRIYDGRMEGTSPSKIYLSVSSGKGGRNIASVIVSSHRKKGIFESKYELRCPNADFIDAAQIGI